MPAKMITSEVPFQMVNGVIYLDVDPSSFRVILSIVSGVAELEDVVSRLSRMDIALLITTARYLLCLDIVENLEDFQKSQESTETKLHEALCELDSVKKEGVTELAKLKDDYEYQLTKIKEGGEFELANAIMSQNVYQLKCTAYLRNRPFNQCGFQIMIVGDINTRNFKLNCIYCGKKELELLQLKDGGKKSGVKGIDIRDLNRVMDALERGNNR
jgi:hypothetical protein